MSARSPTAASRPTTWARSVSVARSSSPAGAGASRSSRSRKPSCASTTTSAYASPADARIRTREGAELLVEAGQFYEIPPGHDSWVVGEEPWITIDWQPSTAFARTEGGDFDRVVATLLVTDIVDSTARAVELGDGAWRDLLARHDQAVRAVLDRFRGREVTTTGDGFVAVFDGAERAIRAAQEIGRAVSGIGLEVRAAVHTGEIELEGGNVRGVGDPYCGADRRPG